MHCFAIQSQVSLNYAASTHHKLQYIHVQTHRVKVASIEVVGVLNFAYHQIMILALRVGSLCRSAVGDLVTSEMLPDTRQCLG